MIRIRYNGRSYNELMGRAAILCALLVGRFAAAQVLTDPRLGSAATEIKALVAETDRAGLPSEFLVDKVREGLAKQVPPARIAVAVRAFQQALVLARAETMRFSPSKPLLRAVAEAHLAGVGAETAIVLQAGGRERAVWVLTDLVQRGYPTAVAASTVAAFATRPSLTELAGHAERLRGIDGASPTEALDALTRANAQGLGLDHAEQLLHADGNGDGNNGNGRGPNRETSGPRGPRSGGVAPPGLAKGKQ
jgi:hypothetical protein